MCIFGNSSKVFQMKLYFFIYFRYSWANSQPSSFHLFVSINIRLLILKELKFLGSKMAGE